MRDVKIPESEKLTINLGHVDLGQIDLLVSERFYANRSDFIRTAIRNQLQRHEDIVKGAVDRADIEMGLRRFSRAELEAAVADGKALDVQVLGLVVIEPDVTAELADQAFARLRYLGALQAPAAVKTILADRTH